jgi:hypothetical protein
MITGGHHRPLRRRPAAGRTPAGPVVEGSANTTGVPSTAVAWVAPTSTTSRVLRRCGGVARASGPSG